MGKQGDSSSSSGQKRKSTGDGNDDDNNRLWLSLGSIYNSAVVVVESAAPTSTLVRDSCNPAVPGIMVPRHSADASSAAGVPVPAGTAFFATGVLTQAQIASSPSILIDGNGGAASPVRFSSLPISSPLHIVAPSTAISLPARQGTAMPTAPPAPTQQDVQAPPAPPLPACTEHRSTRRRANGAPQAPVVVIGGGGSPPLASNGATGRHVSGPPAPPLPACTEHCSTRRRANGARQAPVVVAGGGGSPPPASNGATGRHVSGPPAPPLPARTAHRSTRRRRRANGAPQAPVVVGGGSPPPASNGDATGRHVTTGPPASNSGDLLTIPPFPWATNREAIHQSISELAARGITAIEGEVQCKRCDVRKTISYDVATKFEEVRAFIARNIHGMDDRAPPAWTSRSPAVPDCDSCGQRRSLRPVIPAEKEKINWVFMLLGQTLGLLTLDQLKHFCAHTKQHRTGAKDRVLYSTYMQLCNQLSPDKLFDVTSERKKRSRHYYA